MLYINIIRWPIVTRLVNLVGVLGLVSLVHRQTKTESDGSVPPSHPIPASEQRFMGFCFPSDDVIYKISSLAVSCPEYWNIWVACASPAKNSIHVNGPLS